MKIFILTFLILITNSSSFANTVGGGMSDKMLNRQMNLNMDSSRENLSNSQVYFMGKDQADIKYGALTDSGSVEVYTNRVEEIAPDVTQALRKSRSSGSWEEVFKSNPRSFQDVKKMMQLER